MSDNPDKICLNQMSDNPDNVSNYGSLDLV